MNISVVGESKTCQEDENDKQFKLTLTEFSVYL